jgi:hypothetical protein
MIRCIETFVEQGENLLEFWGSESGEMFAAEAGYHLPEISSVRSSKSKDQHSQDVRCHGPQPETGQKRTLGLQETMAE